MERADTRKTYLDALRILACLGVIFNHVAGGSMRLYDGASGVLALFGFFLSKSAVGVFLLVSGAVLLGRCDSYRRVFGRFLRMLLALIVFSLLNYGVGCLSNPEEAFRPATFLLRLLRGEIVVSYWYLYLYLALLLALPLLQRLSLRMERCDYRYFLIWALLYAGAMPALIAKWPVLQPSSSFQPVLFVAPTGLLLLGRYADAFIPMNGRRALLAAAMAVLPAILPTAVALYDRSLFAILDNYSLPTATAAAVGLFLFVKWLDASLRQSERMRRAISAVGKLTFCTYLIADLLVEKLQFIREALVPLLRTNGAGLLYVPIVFAAGVAVSAVLRQIPGLKKLL